jgi:hypothetical protein
MRVRNMTSNAGNSIANQFVITDDNGNEYFQSYQSIIARRPNSLVKSRISIDEKYWDYSVTTGKYRNQFLGETKKETQAKIDSGEYILADLN